MIKVFSFLAAILLIVSVQPLEAHPPRDIELAYDMEKQTLHIEMVHQVHNTRKDFINKLEVTKGEDEPIVNFYAKQNPGITWAKDVEIEAEAGDIIKIKVLSRDGGSGTAEITVEAAEKSEEEVEPEVEEPVEPVITHEEHIKNIRSQY